MISRNSDKNFFYHWATRRFLSTMYELENSDNDNHHPITTSLLTKKTGLTYGHSTRIRNRLEDSGWIEGEKVGRTRPLRFTEKGKEIAKAFMKLNELIE